MQHLEVSGAVRHIYIYVIRRQRVNTDKYIMNTVYLPETRKGIVAQVLHMWRLNMCLKRIHVELSIPKLGLSDFTMCLGPHTVISDVNRFITYLQTDINDTDCGNSRNELYVSGWLFQIDLFAHLEWCFLPHFTKYKRAVQLFHAHI
jgi:hypothetical protein